MKIIVSLALLIIIAAPAAALGEAGLPAAGRPAADNASPALTLNDAINTALKNNRPLLSEGEKLKASEAGVGEARSAFLPKANVSETFVRSDNPVTVFGSKLNQRSFQASDFAIDKLNSPSPINDFNFRVQVIQPLWNGGKEYLGYKRAELALKSAEMKHERARMETVYETVQVYWGVALAGEYIKTAELAKKSTEKHLKLAQDLYKQGMLIGSEVLLAKVHLADVEEMLIKAKNREATAKAALNRILGRPQDTPVEIADKLGYSAFPGSLHDLQAEALKDRPDLKGMHLDVRNMGEGVSLAKTDYLPNLNLMGQYDRDSRDAFGRGGDSYTLMGRLTWNVFDGFLTTNKVREARAQRNAASYMYDEMREGALFEVRKSYNDLQEAKQRMDVESAAVKEGEESLRIITKRFGAGMAKSLDVIDADTALTRARTNEAQALYDYNVATAALKLATGKRY
ncbi:MAG: TolC family protein [Nitrospirota bacterium]